jgi:hypothetical protein
LNGCAEAAGTLTVIRESEITPASGIANVAGPTVDQIAAELSAVLFNDPVVLPSERKAVRLTLEQLSACSGTFSMKNGMEIEVRLEGDHLLLSTPFAPDEGAYPAGNRRFFLRSEDTDIEFSADAPASSIKVVLPSGQLTGKRRFEFYTP